MSTSNPALVETVDGDGFPNVYVYEYRGVLFGVHKTWRSTPAGWLATERSDGGWGEQFTTGYSLPQTRKAAIQVAVDAIDWRFEVEARACTSGHWGSRAMACDRDGTTQRDGFWLCDAHAANHDALVLAAQREANCQHYADLYGRCMDCGETWRQRARVLEQTPMVWPRVQINSVRSVADATRDAEAGFPTVADGDALAVLRGDIGRLVTIEDGWRMGK